MKRSGSVSFHDASLSIWEEGLCSRETWQEREAWERQFKRDVFARIVQQLRRLGWTVVMPLIDQHSVKQYGGSVARWSAERKRICTKGELKGDLEMGGRHIEFKMFQSVNCPTRPDHEGRYEPNKEEVMPYVLRLEMERTRRRIRTYLCNIFEGYHFSTERGDGRHQKRGLMHLTALEWVQGCYETSSHFKGDITNYTIHGYNNKAADGTTVEHGRRVWFYNHKGRLSTGIAYYNINNMWWVVTGKYDVNNVASFELFTSIPGDPRVKRNSDRRRKRLESELSKAIAGMNFERAALLRDILFPKGTELFVVYHKEHGAYHRTNFRGYTDQLMDAGKFTAEEVKNWNEAPNKVIPLGVAA